MSLSQSQVRVAAFVEQQNMETDPAYRLLDLISEIGELAKDANESTEYGANPDDLSVNVDEIGDALFALLALANGCGIDAEDALDTALEKYQGRIEQSGSPGSNQERTED